MSRKEDYERLDTKKYLNLNLKTDGLPLPDVNAQYIEFFHRMDYKWWRDVEPGDVVVDIGACVGFFVCHALDRGADRIYAIEPSRPHLKTLINNVSDYFIDHGKVPVIPVEAGIGSTANHFNNVFSEYDDFKKMSFLDLVVDYNIPKIDYLKIDCEGGEYGIFNEMNMPYLLENVKHMAVEFHLSCYPGAAKQWQKVRDKLLPQFKKMRWMEKKHRRLAFDDKWLAAGDWSECCAFMVYLTNEE
tara:strand:+ start:484 stop:1215 length:732 start_codon:yes stop_codon:yes gene_type:complete